MKSPEELRQYNTLKVLRYLSEMKVGTKSEIAKATLLTMVTISSIVNHLLAQSVLVQNGIDSQNKGRNSVIYSFNTSVNHIIGINMGIDYISFREEDLEGNIIGRKFIDVELDISYEKVLTLLTDYIKPKEHIIGVGITIPGVSNQKTGKVEFLPNLKSIKGKYLQKDINKLTNIYTIVEKDVYAGVSLYKEHNQLKSIALLSIKGGIGCGVIYNGNVLKGYHSMAGEIGHISIDSEGPLCSCGQKGCIEKYASDYALQERLGFSIDGIIKNANNGDIECIEVLKKACNSLDKLIGYINQFYNPEEIIINCQWLAEAAVINQYFVMLMTRYHNDITIIYDKHNYEKGAVNIVKEQLFYDIKSNILLGG